jgi:Mg2+/Co2+ transporter CorB
LNGADDVSWFWPGFGLFVCIVLSAFFSGTETALMSVNRYRLRHRASQGSRSAMLVEKLLSRPDRLIGVVLIGNTLVNNIAAAIVTTITYRAFGEPWVSVAIGALTLVVLVFSEVGPKTFGALYPDRLAYPSAYVYAPLLQKYSPAVWAAKAVNAFVSGVLRLFGVRVDQAVSQSLSADELRTVVAEAGTLIPLKHQQMLVSILDLERIGVDDIMVPRTEVVGIDLNDDWDTILNALRETQHTRLPVYEGDLDHIVGILHMKRVARELARGELDRDGLVELAKGREPYYVPEGTTLNQQLVAFQQAKRRHAFVVDEYGDVQGLVTLEDILEEIVGEFTTETRTLQRGFRAEPDGSYVVAGSTAVRQINRALGWALPTDGPKTLNGLVVEYLETIPEPGTSLKLHGHPIEVLQIADNTVKTLRVWPLGSTRQA